MGVVIPVIPAEAFEVLPVLGETGYVGGIGQVCGSGDNQGYSGLIMAELIDPRPEFGQRRPVGRFLAGLDKEFCGIIINFLEDLPG